MTMHTILVVDDNEACREAMLASLTHAGFRVFVAADGREGVEAVRQLRPDMVFMDLMMPEMDGYETMRAIREHPEWQSLPIIALTAKAMKGDREKSIDAGASDYITKPVDVEQLLSLMRVWLYQ